MNPGALGYVPFMSRLCPGDVLGSVQEEREREVVLGGGARGFLSRVAFEGGAVEGCFRGLIRAWCRALILRGPEGRGFVNVRSHVAVAAFQCISEDSSASQEDCYVSNEDGNAPLESCNLSQENCSA